MAMLTTMGGVMTCSFGVAPVPLSVLPINCTLATTPGATIMEHVPFLNIPTFGMCQSIANPVVAAATAAALGVFTPMPCIPAVPAPWIPGGPPTVMVKAMPALNNMSKLICIWGGIIQFTMPGQMTVMMP